MRLTASRSIAAASCLLALASLEGARRPRYGGTLRVQMRAAIASLDPSEWPVDSVEAAAKEKLVSHVFETLVRLDDRGDPRPLLATSWTLDTARKRWIFTPRPNVTLHNGAVWSPDPITVPADQPIEQILRDLARPHNAIVVRAADGVLLGTGPFRVTRWEPGKAATLTAHDDYWGGRPYLDALEFQLGRSRRDQTLDFDLGNTDVIEADVADLRRLRQRGIKLAVSPPSETLAIVFDKPVPDAVREAIGLSIDRTAIHSVLLQRQGEISGALLPQWLSGYAFVFPAARDLARARLLAQGSAALSLAYDRQDALARSVAERIAVNAGEAGLSLRAVSSAGAEARLVRLRLTAPEPWTALAGAASALKVQLPENPANPHEAEHALLAAARLIPLFHLPVAWQLAPRVRDWGPSLADAWLDAGATP